MNTAYTFRKTERLSLKKDIDTLFNEGASFNLTPFKVFYMVQIRGEDVPVKVLIGIPKKKIRLAVNRNRLRRQIKEAYRLHKHLLIDRMKSHTGSLHIGFVYARDRSDIAFTELENQMISCLERLGRNITGGNDQVAEK